MSMTKSKRKLIFVICAIAVILAAGTAKANAFFTDYEQAHGGAVIHLSGSTEIKEEADENGKTISISNTGETDVLVRVKVFGEGLTYEAGEDWTEGADGFWYYGKILAPGEETPTLVATIDQEAAKAAGHDFDIIVVQEAARVVYDGTDENNVVKPEGWLLPDISAGM